MEYEISIGKGEWINTTNRYLETLGLTWQKLRSMDRNEIKKNIREWDTDSWKEEMRSKSTMKWYIHYVRRI